MNDNAPLHKGQKPVEGILQSLRDLLPFASQFPAEEAGILWALYQLESDLKSHTSADPEMDADVKQRWLAAEGDFFRFMEGLVSDPSIRGKTAAVTIISLFQLFLIHLLGLVVRLTLRLRPDHMRLRNPESDLLLMLRLTRLGILAAAAVVKFNQWAVAGKVATGETLLTEVNAPYQFGASWGPSVMRAVLEAAHEISYRMSEHSPLAEARRKLTETVRAYVDTRPELSSLVQHLICPPLRWINTCHAIAGLLPTTEQARQALTLWGMEFDRQAGARPLKVAAIKPTKRRPMKVAEADEAAKKLAKQLGETFFLLSEREQAKRIGCSWPTWNKAPFFKEAEKRRVQLMKNSRRATASAQAVSLTDSLQAKIPVGEKDQVLKKLAENEELRRLTAEQLEDNEPSPLDDDEPGSRPRKVSFRKRV